MTQATRPTGYCHCQAVSVTIAAPPPDLNGCNCTLCAKTGGLWGYFDPKNVVIVGETVGYIRRDLKTPALATHFCPRCGVVTYWSPLPGISQGRMGVNMRLFPCEALAGLETRHHDGRSWPLT